jgi:tetratricopeptide (TPR) repeat protein
LSLDPLSQIRLGEAGIGYWWNHDYDRAYELFSKNAELHPDEVWPGDIVATRMMQGRLDEVAELTDALADSPYRHNFVGAYAYQAVGREEEAAAARQWIIDDRGVPLAYQVAEMYAWQGNLDKAFEWLETGFETRDGGMSYLLIDTWLESLHGDPRWRPLLARMNLLEYWDAMPDRQ